MLRQWRLERGNQPWLPALMYVTWQRIARYWLCPDLCLRSFSEISSFMSNYLGYRKRKNAALSFLLLFFLTFYSRTAIKLSNQGMGHAVLRNLSMKVGTWKLNCSYGFSLSFTGLHLEFRGSLPHAWRALQYPQPGLSKRQLHLGVPKG